MKLHRKRIFWGALLGVMLVLAIAIFSLMQLPPQQPTHGDKSLGQWLAVLDGHRAQSPNERSKAQKAIKAIGINAEEYLSYEVNAKESAINKLIARQSWIKIQSTPAVDRRRRALIGYCLLAEKIRPEKRIAESSNFQTNWNHLVFLRGRYRLGWPELTDSIYRTSEIVPVRSTR